jgi:hypothetical protein
MKTGIEGTSPISRIHVLVAIVVLGLLGLVAVPIYSTWVKRSRAAEAGLHLNKLFAASVTYFESSAQRFPGPAAVREIDCCHQNNELCPANPEVYRTDPVWMALNFNILVPHRYRPAYRSSGSGKSAVFVAEANGDLDCDGGLAGFFKRVGRVNEAGAVESSGGIYSENQFE